MDLVEEDPSKKLTINEMVHVTFTLMFWIQMNERLFWGEKSKTKQKASSLKSKNYNESLRNLPKVNEYAYRW